MGEKRNVYRVLVGKAYGIDHLEDLGVDGSVLAELENVIVMKNTGEWHLKG